MRSFQTMALMCCITQSTFAAQQTQSTGGSSYQTHKSQPIAIHRLNLQRVKESRAFVGSPVTKSNNPQPEPKTASPTTSMVSVGSPAVSIASSTSSSSSNESPLDSGRLTIDSGENLRPLPESTASSAATTQASSSTSSVQSITATTLRLINSATTQNHIHMSFGDPDFDPSVMSVPQTIGTSRLSDTYAPDVAEPRAATAESRELEFPEGLQKGMIGYNTARKHLLKRSQSSPESISRSIAQ